MVSYLACKRCGKQGCHVKENRKQRVISRRQLEELKWCGYQKKKKRKVAYSTERKVQQSGIWARALESIEKERSNQRNIRRTFKMLREIWLNIKVEKINMHENIIVKVLLDSGTIGIFMDRKIAARHRFKLQRLERPIQVRNMDRTNNSARAIIYQIEVNVYYKNYVKRIRMDICDLGKTNIILEILWLQAHNPEINWEMREVKITRCLPLCDRIGQKREEKKVKREKIVVTLEEEKIVRWIIDNKKNWEKKKK